MRREGGVSGVCVGTGGARECTGGVRKPCEASGNNGNAASCSRRAGLAEVRAAGGVVRGAGGGSEVGTARHAHVRRTGERMSGNIVTGEREENEGRHNKRVDVGLPCKLGRNGHAWRPRVGLGAGRVMHTTRPWYSQGRPAPAGPAVAPRTWMTPA